MRVLTSFPALLAAGSLLGGLVVPPSAGHAAPAKVRLPKKAVCAVCGVREHAGPEPVAASAEYAGKTYYFCSEGCKTEFLEDPKKWVAAAAAAPAPDESTPKEGAPKEGAAAAPS
jgi:YHS domain-containing protein